MVMCWLWIFQLCVSTSIQDHTLQGYSRSGHTVDDVVQEVDLQRHHRRLVNAGRLEQMAGANLRPRRMRTFEESVVAFEVTAPYMEQQHAWLCSMCELERCGHALTEQESICHPAALSCCNMAMIRQCVLPHAALVAACLFC